eukprot:12118659-Prorocentrum_lima.AAC.1
MVAITLVSRPLVFFAGATASDLSQLEAMKKIDREAVQEQLVGASEIDAQANLLLQLLQKTPQETWPTRSDVGIAEAWHTIVPAVSD